MLLEALEIPLKTIDSDFKAGIAAAAAGVAALVAGMGLAIKATFKWADELDSIQDIMGVTNKTAAALNFTLRKSGTSTEALTKGMTILSKGLIKADGSLDTTGKSLKAWGINVLDANGMLKDQTALIGDISDKYSTFATQQEKVNFLTETFGRSGAELIDFFDTLAAEGGIDSVAAKVERLGLAIDPNRYEQFNRNLEELKLVGLGLAVSFTEKVMPVIEKFLGLIADPKGIDIGKIGTWADNTIGTYLKGLGDSVNTWVNSGGPEKLSDDIVAWVEDLGTGEAFKSKALIGAQHLVTAIGEALGDFKWEAIGTALDTKMAEIINAQKWQASGDAFGDKLEQVIKDAMAGMGQGGEGENMSAKEGLLKLLLPGPTAVAKFLNNTQFGTAVSNAVANWWKGAVGPENLAAFNTLGPNISAKIRTAMSEATAAMNAKLLELKTAVNQKLTDIAKEFYNRGTGWANQAAQGFEAGKNTILGKIREIVALINGILKKIITSFSITVHMPDLGSLFGGGSTGTLGGGNKKRPDRRTDGPMASGGPVIGGGAYMVGEMGPELFVPRSNGAIVPNNQLGQPTTARLDDSQLRMLAGLIGESVIKAMNNA